VSQPTDTPTASAPEDERDPLASLAACEAGMFRIGVLARRLRAEHPDIPLYAMSPVWSLLDGHLTLDIHADDAASAHAWAQACGGITVTSTVVEPGTPGGLWPHLFRGTGQVDGVPVLIHCADFLTAGQAADLTTAQLQDGGDPS
jgi:hypothetical protein